MTSPKESPILFSTEMVKAIFNGQKTQTRRILNPQPENLIKEFELHNFETIEEWEIGNVLEDESSGDFEIRKSNYEWIADLKNPFGAPGDILWVRESHKRYRIENNYYFQFFDDFIIERYFKKFSIDQLKRWKLSGKKAKDLIPSIFMPKEAARIWLEVESIRVERLQDISEEDAIAEGVGSGFQMNSGWPDYQHIKNGICELTQDTARMSYATLWDSINGEEGWNKNPWIWAINFKVLSTTGKPQTLTPELSTLNNLTQ